MSKLEAAVEELKTLPADRLELAADYIHRLRTVNGTERETILRRTAGSLNAGEADDLQRIIDQACERIDERDW